jgi:NTE family protein
MTLARLLALGGISITTLGCAAFNYAEPDGPVAELSAAPVHPRPEVALVLGSGGPRGYAHIGIMKVLDEACIDYDLVVGSSVGSLIGAFWASGMGVDEIDEIARGGGPLTLFDPSLFADRGWIRGQRLQDYVNSRLGVGTIERLPRSLIIVATRREDKAPVFFQTGNIGVAVRASSAMPGIISPVGINGTEFEDADESLPVAVRAAREAGARFVIAVDVSAKAGAAPDGTARALLDRDARRRSRIDPEVARADFLIHPDLDYAAGPSRSYFLNAQVQGELSARQSLPALVERLRRAGVSGPIDSNPDACASDGRRPPGPSAAVISTG